MIPATAVLRPPRGGPMDRKLRPATSAESNTTASWAASAEGATAKSAATKTAAARVSVVGVKVASLRMGLSLLFPVGPRPANLDRPSPRRQSRRGGRLSGVRKHQVDDPAREVAGLLRVRPRIELRWGEVFRAVEGEFAVPSKLPGYTRQPLDLGEQIRR